MTPYTCPQCNNASDTYQPVCPKCGIQLPEPESSGGSQFTLPLSGAPGAPTGQPQPDEAEQTWAGQQVANFLILEKIAKGGFGEVYRALDVKLDREVAIKFLKPEATAEKAHLSNLKHEAKAASALNHPNICTIYELGDIDEQVYIVMELLDGHTLKQSLPAHGFDLDPFLDMAIQIAQGLEEAHRQNIIHRDIKPGNIQITNRNQVKILDFGLAKRHNAEKALESAQYSVDGQTMGTLHYMSPEQVLGEKLDYRSDIFSLGIVFYQMLTGKLPFKQDSLYATMDDIVNATPEPVASFNPSIPKEISQIITKMLSKEPAKRYANVGEVIDELRTFETKIKAPPPRPVWPVLLLSLLPLLAVLGILAWRSIHSKAMVTLALTPLKYEGPEHQETLPETLGSLVYQALDNHPKTNVVPLMTTRQLDPLNTAEESAQQLDVNHIIGGTVRIENQSYLANMWVHRQGYQEPIWRQEFTGEVSELYSNFAEMGDALRKALKLKALANSKNILTSTPEAVAAFRKGMKTLEDYNTKVDTTKAYEAFREALRIDPNFPSAHAGLAMTHWFDFVRNGDVDHVEKASQEANLAISKAPNQPEGYMAVGMVALGRGRTNEAMEMFRQAQDLAPADESIAVQIGNAFAELNRFEPAETMYKQAIALREGFWVPYLKLGRLYFHHNQNDKAKEMFQKVIDLNPRSDLGYNNLAAVYMVQGDFQEAAPLLALGLKYYASTEAHSNLGFIYFTLEQFDDAADQFRKAIDLNPNDPITYGNLGDALRHANRPQEAIDAYTVAIEKLEKRLAINPRDWDDKAILAMFQACAQLCNKSQYQLDDLQGRWSAERHYYAAIAFAVCKKAEQAKEHIRAALTAKFTADIPTNLDLQPYLDQELLDLIEAN